MSRVQLVIGNKNYSSWSLRAWLALKKTGTTFDEIRVPLYVPGHTQALLAYTPSAKVPVLIDDGIKVWDSLAILEYLAERHRSLWPNDPLARAHARSICAEMHSGFRALRSQMPMNCRATDRIVIPDEEATDDIARIEEIWSECRGRSRSDGNWLFGSFTNADAMFAPVALRFRTYGVVLDAEASRYVATVGNDELVKAWCAAAALERESLPHFEKGTT